MKNGKVVMRNNRYIALPDNNSRTAVITVSDGADVLARYEYEVRNLPAPQPYLSYSHNGKTRYTRVMYLLAKVICSA